MPTHNPIKLGEILELRHTINKATADSKKSVLELISRLIAEDLVNIEYAQIFDCLLEREKIGSTGIGHGVAIPHCRMENIIQPICALIHLKKPIDFATIDNQPADLFFALLIPEASAEHYLDILAKLAEKFGNKNFRKKLRQSKTNKELYQIATGN